jgi:hypothetical protein
MKKNIIIGGLAATTAALGITRVIIGELAA